MKPIQQHILFCTGSDCKKRNKKAYKAMKSELKNSKQNFTRCSTTQCLGACKHAPVMVVYPDGTWYGDVSSSDMKAVVEEHIVGGKPIKKQVLHQMNSEK